MASRNISRRVVLLGFGAAAGLAAPRRTAAQFSSGVQVVNVFVTVRDRQGKLVRGLTQNDFQLTEEGRAQPIRYFSAQSGLPLTLGLLFDISGSQRAVIERQRRASTAFLNQILLNPQDQAVLVAFHRQVRLLQPLTPSLSQLTNGLARLDVPRLQDGTLDPEAQGTALFDAVIAVAGMLREEAGRKAVVLLTDGYDTASSSKFDAAVESAQRANVLLYPIRFYDRQVFAYDVNSRATAQLRVGKRDLQRMAQNTGGGFFEISETETLESSFAGIEDELRNQYSLGFTPGSTRSGYRRLRVTLKGAAASNGWKVQARDGYYPGN